METQTDIRPSPIAGRWYPGNTQELTDSVDAYIRSARPPAIPGEIIGLVAPHAGHVYSGPVAGHAFAAVQGYSPALVIIISPMHQPYSQPLLTSGHTAYYTPLGAVQIDQQALDALDQKLSGQLGVGLTPVRGDQEHALEIELPFLQRVLARDFQLLPIMLRDHSPTLLQGLGECLAEVIINELGAGQTALLVASTDLSHFYPQKTAEVLDQEMLRRIAAFDPDAVLQAEAQGVGFACGRGAVAAVLWAARALGADEVTVLNYATSGDISGDYTQVVGYGAAAISISSKE